jgi:hypothetical protein
LGAIKNIYIIALSFLLLSGSIIMIEDGWRVYQNLIVPATLAIIVLLMLGEKNKIQLRIFKRNTLILYLYLISAIISSLLNDNFRMALHSLQIFTMYIVITLLLPNVFKQNYLKVIIISVLLGHIPLVVNPTLLQIFSTDPYSGVFRNANSFGSVLATMFPMLLVLINDQIKVTYNKFKRVITLQNKNLFIFYNFLAFANIFMVVLSKSRTSIFTVTILLVLFLIILSKRLGIKVTVKKLVPLIVLLLSIMVLTPPINSAITNVVEKNFQRTEIHSGGITTGRADVWLTTISDAKLFGLGHNYFEVVVPINPHNTFIEILGIYGWVPFFFYSLWILITLNLSLKFIKNNNIRFNYLPFLLMVTFILLSIGEVMTMKLSMIAMFASIGVIIKGKGKL